jgi:hypothetical protein
VKVEEDDRGLLPGRLDEPVDDPERVNGDVQEELALQVDHGDGGAVTGLDHGEPAARDLVAAQVRGPKHPWARGEQGLQVAVAPDVVPRRDHVRPRGQELPRELRGEPDAVRGVLAVHHAKLDGELLFQLRKSFFDGTATGRSEHIAEKEDAQGGGF